jgi:hypothetical protein
MFIAAMTLYARKFFDVEATAHLCRFLCKTMQNTGLLCLQLMYFAIFQSVKGN